MCAADDTAAIAEAKVLYRGHTSQRIIVNSHLCDSFGVYALRRKWMTSLAVSDKARKLPMGTAA
jgi:hypothetical protein